MVGILLSYWVSAYFQGRAVSFTEGKYTVRPMDPEGALLANFTECRDTAA